ncbi:MAG TPA: hypothetical protein VMW48_01890 [Vicinamibacterales bacterium]|nr:hypothetical protein [Vicinamibacterales bacterium]
MSAERQRQVLMGLLAVLAVVGGWRYLGAAAPSGPAAATAARRAEIATAVVTPVDVRLDALDGARPGPQEATRNPFVFGGRAAAPGPVGRGTANSGIAPAPPPPMLPPGPPPLPPIPFKFIGLVEGASGGRRIAVLSDSKGLVVHGAEGAIIDGRFRILSIGADTVEIAYADGRGRQTLRLSGQ